MGEQSSKKGVAFFIVVVILGALLGGVLGEILGLIVREGIWHRILVTGVRPALSPVNIDLAVFHFTFGVGMKLNLLSVFGIMGAIWLYYKL
ncbi:MAG TPA: DUF4321 domain-containing protein [Candidatus Omnitrophica bacterium]|nr:DUF4321 domain-containing protein [Candidatus Omnitrophota bacterium]